MQPGPCIAEKQQKGPVKWALSFLSQIIDSAISYMSCSDLSHPRQGSCDGLTVCAAVDGLRAVLNVAFYHYPLYHSSYILAEPHGLEDLAGYPYLFEILFTRIGVVGIHYDSRIFPVPSSGTSR